MRELEFSYESTEVLQQGNWNLLVKRKEEAENDNTKGMRTGE
jgi:hypothetical protein